MYTQKLPPRTWFTCDIHVSFGVTYYYLILTILVYLFLIKHFYFKTSFFDVTDQFCRNFPRVKKPAPSNTGINNNVLNESVHNTALLIFYFLPSKLPCFILGGINTHLYTVISFLWVTIKIHKTKYDKHFGTNGTYRTFSKTFKIGLIYFITLYLIIFIIYFQQ